MMTFTSKFWKYIGTESLPARLDIVQEGREALMAQWMTCVFFMVYLIVFFMALSVDPVLLLTLLPGGWTSCPSLWDRVEMVLRMQKHQASWARPASLKEIQPRFAR